MVSNDEIRYRILQTTCDAYYKDPTDSGIDRNSMTELLRVSSRLVDANVFYLEEKRLIKLQKHYGVPWAFASITAFGIDVIEKKEKYKDQFPFIQIQIVEGPVHGPVVQAGAGSQVTITQIGEAFQRARDLTEAKTDISKDLKRGIQDNLTILEEEIKKDELESGKIKKIWGWLKENASWVIPILKDIILEGMKKGI